MMAIDDYDSCGSRRLANPHLLSRNEMRRVEP